MIDLEKTDLEEETGTDKEDQGITIIDKIDTTVEDRMFPEEDMTETTTVEEEKKEDIDKIEDPEKIDLANMPKKENNSQEETENLSVGPN